MNKAIILEKVISVKPRQTHHQTIFQIVKGFKNHTMYTAGCLVFVTLSPAKSYMHAFALASYGLASALVPLSIRTTNVWFLKSRDSKVKINFLPCHI